MANLSSPLQPPSYLSGWQYQPSWCLPTTPLLSSHSSQEMLLNPQISPDHTAPSSNPLMILYIPSPCGILDKTQIAFSHHSNLSSEITSSKRPSLTIHLISTPHPAHRHFLSQPFELCICLLPCFLSPPQDCKPHEGRDFVSLVHSLTPVTSRDMGGNR